MIPASRLRSVATVIAVVGLLAVVVVGVVGAVLQASPERSSTERSSSERSSTDSAAGEGRSPAVVPVSPSAAPSVAPAQGEWVVPRVPAGWRTVGVAGSGSYAVPPSWRARPVQERLAYRDEGQVAVEGRALTQSWENDCRADLAPVPVAFALLGAPVRSTNVAGVARAAAAAWARGYAALGPGDVVPSAAVRPVRLGDDSGVAATVTVDLSGSANPCAGETAELTVVAVPWGGEVRSLVVARYLGVRGTPGDAAYSGVVGSLRP